MPTLLSNFKVDVFYIVASLPFYLNIYNRRFLPVFWFWFHFSFTIHWQISPFPQIITAEGVPVVQDDIHVANGYVHAIDGLMTPPEGTIHSLICGRADLSTMCSLANQTGVFNRIDSKNNKSVGIFTFFPLLFLSLLLSIRKCLSVCLFVHLFLGHLETDSDPFGTRWFLILGSF